jgi:YgiT-type zinc finger domain-containing protein
MILERGDKTMRCVICKHGQTKAGLTTVTLNRDHCVVIFKQVPAEICTNCGEYYLSDRITDDLLQQAEQAIASGAEVEIRRYVEAARAF